jgi:hypothetical protein
VVHPSVATAAHLLFQRTASLRAVQNNETNQFTRALAALARVADRLKSPVAIVGGLAAIHHGVPVATTDIDIIVGKEDLPHFLDAARLEGMTDIRESPMGWHSLRYVDPHGNVEIQVLPAGQKSPRDPSYAPPLPEPRELGVAHGLGFASFPTWVALKLIASRDKDRYHLVEALKHASPEQIASVVHYLRQLDSRYLAAFERCVRAAEDEKQNYG